MKTREEIRTEEERKRYEERRARQRRELRRKKQRRKRRIRRFLMVLVFTVLAAVIVLGVHYLQQKQATEETLQPDETKYIADAPDFRVELLTYNEYSRPGTALEQVNGIVIH